MSNNEFGIKRPNFIIYTDKDGTINLEDKKLDHVLKLILSMNGIVIPITGRTVGDMEESLKANGLMIPKILVGDNGANIYATSQNKFLIQKTLDRKKVIAILDEFMNHGRIEENIRLTTGNTIYTVDTPAVRDYYQKSKIVQYYSNLDDLLASIPTITKVALYGSKEDLLYMADYVKQLDFWSDLGSTKFPYHSSGNHRLDIADRNINKGSAVKVINSTLQPLWGYICIGNGENDIPMFKQAIDDGMIIGIMEDSPQAIKDEMRNYISLKKKRKNDNHSS